MKKLLLLVVMCFVGMMVPQGVLAAVYNADNLMVTTSDDGKTVTIHSDQASALWALFSFGDETTKQNIISAIQGANGPDSQIIFDGEFSGSDLEILSTNNCCVQETVNMAETTFKKHIDLREAMDAYIINSAHQHNNGGGKTPTGRLNHIAQSQGITVADGDIGVYEGAFYKYNASTEEWEATTDPCFVSKERMMELVNGQWNACTLANVGGEPTIFKYANNPETHQNEWYALNVNDYESMTFKYWGSNVKTAITSKNAGPEDSASDQLCDGCTNLTTLTLNSGKFPGLGNNVGSLTTVNIKQDVTELGDALFSGKQTVSTVNFETGGTKPLVIGNYCFNNCYAMQGELTIPARTTSLGNAAFYKAGSKDGDTQTGFNELNVTFEGTCQLTTFEKDVFAYSGITSLTVPNSIQEIKTQAFDNCINLQEVIINEGTSLHAIRNRAFQGCNNIDNVWVNVNCDEHLIICEYNAFSFEGLVGQTQEESHMTILHFPEDNNSHPNNFNYYAGEWKKGMAFTQSELNAFKDGIEIKEGEETLYYNPDTMNPSFWSQEYGFSAIDHYTNIDGYYHDPDGGNKKYAPANGWQQFAKTDSEREIYVTGNVYMTYSTDKPYSLPKGIVAFRVTDYKDPEIDPNSGKMIKGTLVLKMIDQVPTQTGMLLISTNQYLLKVDKNRAEEVQSTFYFGDPEGTPQPYPYVMGREGDDTSNYLAPAVHDIEVGPVSGAPESTTGVVNVNAHPFTHRNFALSKSTHRFVRLKHYIMPDNKAFLSLPIEMFDNPNEDASEGPNPYNTFAGDYLYNYDPTVTSNGSNGAKPAFIFDYDVEKYGMIWPLASVIDDNMGITTGISTLQQENAAEGIYTIQGVKVSAPNTKGIYIVNGKKVVFK